MPDDHRKLALTVPRWLVDLVDQLVGCVFFEPHSTPGRINHILLHNRGAALTHLAGRGVSQVETTIREQIDRERREHGGWQTIRRFFAENREERSFERRHAGDRDHAALAILTAWSGDEDDEGLPESEVGHNVEALEASLHRLERAAEALRRARAEHVPIAAAA